MTVTAYVTEIFSIFCEIFSLFVKHCLLKGFYPYLNFYLSSWNMFGKMMDVDGGGFSKIPFDF
jgi:hypothetical protein